MIKLTEKVRTASKREIGRVIAGVSLIILVLIINGFLSFVTMGFDFSKIKTSGYWTNFALLTVSEMAVMLGMYIIQKSKDLKNSKLIDIQEDIKRQRQVVYQTNQVMRAEDWLREVLNYQERLNLFEKIVKINFEKLKLEEPDINDKYYARKKTRFDKQQEQKKFLCKQIEYIKKDRERLQLWNKKDDERYKTLEKELKEAEDYVFSSTKIKHRDIAWSNLLSDMDEEDKRDKGVFFSEKTELSKKMAQYVAIGSITSSFIACLAYPQFNNFGWGAVLSSLITFCILITFMIRGITLSNTIFLKKYYSSLEARKTIYIKMLNDLGLSKVVIETIKKDEKKEG